MKFWQMVSYMEVDQLVEVARIAEEVGFEGVMGSDHVLYPQNMETPYPYSSDGKIFINGESEFPDPWVSTAAMAAATSRLKFSTSIYILPLRNPIEIARAASTLSIMTNERFILSAGVGWMKEEFDNYGIDFRSRGRRTDEIIEVLHKLWGEDWVEHHGEFFHYDKIKVRPRPRQAIPIFTGGSSPAALKRAARSADGWIGHGNTPEEVPELMRKLAALRADYGRSELPFETVLGLTSPPDYDTFKRLEEVGMTAGVSYPFPLVFERNSSLDEKRRYMENFSEQFIQKLA
ncbi:MAG: TIGR03619 family F420-dependent LLM class oxidoreductase [Gammaproteobacteria bacterium]|nr:TIGR03619 family F420-dependent LLM class oxidoreductase [Gammaproteobacteria bacterium]